MDFEYYPQGVCTTRMTFSVRDGKVYDVVFENGCSGTSQGLARMVEGKSVKSVIKRLSGIACRQKTTSCPDQFTKALKAALEQLSSEQN